MNNFISGIFEKIIALIGALLFSQFPQLMLQYRFNLAGHVAELKIHIEAMQKIAANSGKTLDVFVRKFLENPDTDISHQGELMRNMVDRYIDLSDAQQALVDSSLIMRPLVFIYHMNWEILKEACATFQIGFSLNIESVVYAAIGGVLAFLICRFLSRGIRKVAFG